VTRRIINFAWVAANETTFGVEHQREDEKVASFDFEQDEGDFGNLTVTIRNPRIGPLNASRKQWAWLSVDATPLFFGRLIAIPNDINKAAVNFVFVARPADFNDQKEAIAAGLRTLPYYDPVWLTQEAQSKADTVLEARPERWCIDRVTGEVTTSHILAGEDGLQEFLPNEIPYDSVEIHIGQVPTRSLRIVGDVGWSQSFAGGVDLGRFTVVTYTGKSLLSDWPKTGANLGGGWFVSGSTITDNWNIDGTDTSSINVSWSNESATKSPGDTVSNSISTTRPTLQGGDSIEILLTASGSSGASGAKSQNTSLVVPEWAITATLALGYSTTRDRHESVAFTLTANFQDMITVPDEEDVEVLSISGGDVGLATIVPGVGTEIPIGDVRNRTYFTTARGLRSLEWLILRGRSQLMQAARAVEVTCEIPFDRAIALSLRMNGRIHDRRLPGGVAEGKIIKFGFSSDGSQASRIGTVTIGCAIGYAGTVATVAGTPDYCDDDYVQPDYQHHTGQVVVLDASDIGYTPPAFSNTVDDGLHFPLTRGAVKSAVIIGSNSAQRSFINSLNEIPNLNGVGGSDLDELIKIISARGETVPKQLDAGLKTLSHYLSLRLTNLNTGPFNNAYEVVTTQLELPKGIDLAAGSS
jgi:hypothetical protein